ncbi:MAG: thioredoxin-like domain-containing protein [Bacteroidales bacterium]|jgi:thiol-disulfide isomerase/thioredoxin
MKKFLVLLISSFTILLFSCQSKNTISGKIEGLENAQLSLVALQDGDNVTLETITSTDGSFSFKNNYDSIFYAAISFEEKPLVAFFVEKGNIIIKSDINNPGELSVVGSVITDNYTNFNEKYYTKEIDMYSTYNQIRILNSDPNNLNQSVIDSLSTELDNLEEEMNQLIREYIKENKNNISGPLVTYQYNYLLTEELFEINELFEEDAKKGYYYRKLSELLSRLENIQIGKPYIDFEMLTPDSIPQKISDYVGNGYLLVDFWASWCGPCRQENPYVVDVYQKYHKHGFDIVGVSFDSDKESWIKAIKDDNLTWHHISELNKWDNIAADLYVVKAIPSNVLLDKDGIIVARNLRGEDLDNFLSNVYLD